MSDQTGRNNMAKTTIKKTTTKLPSNAPKWVINGLKDEGFHETGNNRGIEKFIEQGKCGKLGDPWCAIWVNAKLEQSGVTGRRSASSQSFRKNKNFIKLDGPALGAIAVYWRKSQKYGLGHVGFYMGETKTQVLTLGGNESDAVRQQFEQTSFVWLLVAEVGTVAREGSHYCEAGGRPSRRQSDLIAPKVFRDPASRAAVLRLRCVTSKMHSAEMPAIFDPRHRARRKG
jgi:uncharacterized protein (TIGR02594 family)